MKLPLARSQLSAQIYLDRVAAEVRELLGCQYPGNHEGPLLWLRFVKGLLDTASEYLNNSRNKTASPDEARRLVQEANGLTHLAFHECLPFMTGAGFKELPYSIVQPMQDWFDQLGLENTVLFRAEHAANYEILQIERAKFNRIRDQSESLIDAKIKINWPLIRVTVPGKALGIIPHFAIVAHEVGHVIGPTMNVDLVSKSQAYKDLKDRIETQLSQTSLAVTPERLKQILVSWWEELTADAVAFVITGPAMFFALSEFLQLLPSVYGLSETHPPNVLRRDLLFDKLSKGKGSYLNVFERHAGISLSAEINSALMQPLPSAKDLFGYLVQQNFTEEDAAIMTELIPYFREVYSEIFSKVEAYFDEHFPDMCYSSTLYDKDLSDHLIPLLSAIPPIETGQKIDQRSPSSFTSILNVGWVVLLAKLNEMKISTQGVSGDTGKADVLNGLLLKAVELSEARRTWESAG